MKIGLTGSALFIKKIKVKELIWMIKNLDDTEIEIVSLGGEYGADKFVKKYSYEFDLKYSEFIPRYKRWNSNCIEKPFLFNKKYSPKYFFINYNSFIKYCDKFTFFSNENDRLNDNKLIAMIKKSKKQLVIIV